MKFWKRHKAPTYQIGKYTMTLQQVEAATLMWGPNYLRELAGLPEFDGEQE